MNKPESIWLISGTRPGTGATTLAERISNQYDLLRISAGWIRRAIALHWQTTTAEKAPTQSEWQRFRDLYYTAVENGVDSLLLLLKPYFNQPANEKVLSDFSHHQAQFALHDPFWEYLPDLVCQKMLHEGSPAVIEGKLAVLLNLIEIYGFEKTYTEFALPIIRVLPDVSETEAARRVVTREIKLAHDRNDFTSPYYLLEPGTTAFMAALEMVKQSNEERLQRDWDSFPYKINGRQIQHQDLWLNDPIVIDTSDKTPEEVFALALYHATLRFPDLFASSEKKRVRKAHPQT